jgi:predicted ATP-binding protein involved in virulence
MIVSRLKLAGTRVIETAEFTFGLGLNLIAGPNGAGKSTALEALSVGLSQVSKRVNGLRGAGTGFTTEDINASWDALTVEMNVEIDGRSYPYLHLQPREAVAARSGRSDIPREQAINTPTVSRFTDSLPPILAGDSDQHPIALFFSTRRSLPSDRAPNRSASAGGYRTAFADAFSHRELRLGEFASWLRAETALSEETLFPRTEILEAFEDTIQRFLPGYTDIRVTDDSRPRLIVSKNDMDIPVDQLSDGERGILALVFDLTRRLAQANPGVSDPASVGRGVVLIDEIDLHLHPRWQREIVTRLPETFPNLQFIATTHSPQIIGEVRPERVQIMGYGPVFSPWHSFGVDSSRILEEVMDTPPRTEKVQSMLRQLSDRMEEDDHEAARSVTEQLSQLLGDNDPEVVRARTFLDFMADDE